MPIDFEKKKQLKLKRTRVKAANEILKVLVDHQNEVDEELKAGFAQAIQMIKEYRSENERSPKILY
jgi:hypothetical protein